MTDMEKFKMKLAKALDEVFEEMGEEFFKISWFNQSHYVKDLK